MTGEQLSVLDVVIRRVVALETCGLQSARNVEGLARNVASLAAFAQSVKTRCAELQHKIADLQRRADELERQNQALEIENAALNKLRTLVYAQIEKEEKNRA